MVSDVIYFDTLLEDPMGRIRITRATRSALAAAVLSMGLIAAGCSDNSSDSSATETATVTVTQGASEGSASSTSTRAGESSPSATRDQALDAKRALTVALGHIPGSYAVELDEEDDRSWEITLVTGGTGDAKAIEVIVDGVSGAVTSERPTVLNSWEREAPQVTAAEAIAIALAEKPGRLDALDFDRENGNTVWEAKIISGDGEWELWIDPVSGKIMKTEYDD